METGRIGIGDIEIHYCLSGPAGAPVVCLNHCFGSNLAYWDFHLSAFEGFRVLRYDTRGHGNSDAPPGPYTLSMLASDVTRLQDALGIDRTHFCGVSLGGQIAQTVAIACPERVMSLILVNTTCEFSMQQIQLWRERAQLVLQQGIDAVLDPLLRRWFTSDAANRQSSGYLYMKQAIRDFAPASFDAVSSAMCLLDTASRLPEIAVPALVIGTPDDPGAPTAVTQKMARLIPDARLEWLQPARHLASLEHPERFNALVRGFLADLR